jgi:hypothetical protein
LELEAFIDFSQRELFRCTGSFEMSVFQMLFDGKTGHPPTESGGLGNAGSRGIALASRIVALG